MFIRIKIIIACWIGIKIKVGKSSIRIRILIAISLVIVKILIVIKWIKFRKWSVKVIKGKRFLIITGIVNRNVVIRPIEWKNNIDIIINKGIR